MWRYHENLPKNDNDIITDVKFKTFGCGSAIASTQWLLSLSRARASKKLLNYLTRQWLKLLMVYHQGRYTCSVLAEEAIKAALVDYYEKMDLSFHRRLRTFEPSEEE